MTSLEPNYDTELMLRFARKYPHIEVCGYFWPSGLTLPMKNIAKNADKFFMMDFDEQIAMVEAYGRPAGCWHSHPNGKSEPSTPDIIFHGEAELRMLIIANGEVHDHGIPGQEAATLLLASGGGFRGEAVDYPRSDAGSDGA